MSYGVGEKYAVNRFPIAAAWYRVVAEQLGYDEEESMSLGLARAVFFAAAKRGFKTGGKKYSRKYDPKNTKVVPIEFNRYRNPTYIRENDIDSVYFAGLPTYIAHFDGGRMVAIIGDEAQTPEKYGKVKNQPPDLTAGEFNRSE